MTAPTELTQARARIAELEKALRPFADINGEGDEDYGDDKKVVITFGRTTHYTVRLGDLRRARAAMWALGAVRSQDSSVDRETFELSIDEAIKAERELCAKVADDFSEEGRFSVHDKSWRDYTPTEVYQAAASDVANWIAKDIRARAALAGDKREGGE